MTNKNEVLNKVVALKKEIENYVHSKGINVPSTFIESIKQDKNTNELLKEITQSVSASVGLDVHEKISDHYNTSYSIWSELYLWDKEVRAEIKALIIEKINDAKPTAKNTELFFFEDEKPIKEEREKVLNLHKTIANCAIEYTFDKHESDNAELQTKAFEALLQLIDVQGAFPSNGSIHVRNLISVDRYKAITKKDKDPAASIKALKTVARNWYQNSNRKDLYHKDGYHRYDYVDCYLYLLTPEQLENLRAEFLEDVEKSYTELKGQIWDPYAVSSAEYLLERVKRIMSWRIEN